MGWFRAHENISADSKYLMIAERTGLPVERVVAVWLALLDHANQAGGNGDIREFDPEACASFLRCQVDDVEAIMGAMRRPKRDGSPGMLHGIRITSWRKRNPLREDAGAADRKRRQRDRDRAEDDEPVTPPVVPETASPRPAAVIGDDPGHEDGHDRPRPVTPGHAPTRPITTDRLDRLDRQTDSPPNPLSPDEPEDDDPADADEDPKRPAKPEPPGFEEFWSFYPRRKGKGGARRAWLKAIRKVAKAEILAGVRRALPGWQADPRFIPNPETWLNQERWTDEPDPAAHAARASPALRNGDAERFARAKAKERLAAEGVDLFAEDYDRRLAAATVEIVNGR